MRFRFTVKNEAGYEVGHAGKSRVVWVVLCVRVRRPEVPVVVELVLDPNGIVRRPNDAEREQQPEHEVYDLVNRPLDLTALAGCPS